jgi:hypothetical protein
MPGDDSNPASNTASSVSGGGLESRIDMLLNAYVSAVERGVPAPVTDAITQALLIALGTGPSFAVLQSMISANQANGLMYHNAVSLQQRTNIVGMVATMKCVQNLLDLPGDDDWPGVIDADNAQAKS